MVNEYNDITMNHPSFTLHQTIHGYDDGHRLLKSSRQLPAQVERLMLVMSDMSGASMVNGFENYLTGYPVPEADSYAVARTWYAPEMKRPGCVWTHTILIENSDLAHIIDLKKLTKLFERPSQDPLSWKKYSLPVTFFENIEEFSVDRTHIESQSTARATIHALYTAPQKQVFLAVSKTDFSLENMTLSIWSQQWPRLRRMFCYCTGSIADRKLPDRTFDLQIIPQSSIRELNFLPEDAMLITQEVLNSPCAPWVSATVDDLGAEQSDFRAFLKYFGAETPGGRKSFEPLAMLFVNSKESGNEGRSVADFLINISKIFPKAKDGLRTKSRFFGNVIERKQWPESLFPSFSELEILTALTATNLHYSFDPQIMQVKSRIVSLFEEQPDLSKDLIVSILKESDNPFADQMIDGIISRIKAEQPYTFSKGQFEVLVELLNRNPELYAFPNVWRVSASQQKKLFNLIRSRTEITSEQIGEIVLANLAANSHAIASELALSHPEETVVCLLTYCSETLNGPPEKLASAWLDVLRDNPNLCVDWLNKNHDISSNVLALLATFLDPNSRSVLRTKPEKWLKLADMTVLPSSESNKIKIAAFLLTYAFNCSETTACELVASSFETVHNAAMKGTLPDKQWSYLSQTAPSTLFAPDWDHCARLRTALVDRFIKNRWPKQYFLKSLINTKLLKTVVQETWESGFWIWKQRKFIESVIDCVETNKIESTETQKKILLRAVER